MTYSDQQLEQIQAWAEMYVTITDMAVMMDLRPHQLREDIRDETNPVSLAYRKGKALSKLKLRQQEMNLAMIGSPLALENTHRNLLDMEDDE